MKYILMFKKIFVIIFSRINFFVFYDLSSISIRVENEGIDTACALILGTNWFGVMLAVAKLPFVEIGNGSKSYLLDAFTKIMQRISSAIYPPDFAIKVFRTYHSLIGDLLTTLVSSGEHH